MATDTVSITCARPVAAFSATPTAGRWPLTVAFTDRSIHSPRSWLWNFGDGSTSTARDPTHTYTKAGAFTVTLTVSNAFGSDEMVRMQYIHVSCPLIPLPGYSALPTDPDGDGLYEDLNGNGMLDFADVQLYFQYMSWIVGNEPVALFDYSGDGTIDSADIQLLFAEI